MQSLLEFMNRDRLKKYKIYNYSPESKYELQKIIKQLIKERGWKANLNDIDTSEIWDMSGLFSRTEGGDLYKFDGDISQWDVSSVTNMCKMFSASKFNGNIEDWEVYNVRNMNMMFAWSKFNGNIEDWEVNSKCDTVFMFASCPLESNPPKWYKS